MNIVRNNDGLLLIGRVLLGLIYASAVMALIAGKVPVDFAANGAKFIALPAVLVWIGYIVKVVSGICVLVGFKTRMAAFGLIIFTLITAFNFHDIGSAVFMKEISMLGGLLLLLSVGPGRFSIDGK